MATKTRFIIKIVLLIIFNLINYNLFSQAKFPYDSLKKAQLLVNPNYYDDKDIEQEIKPLEQERIAVLADKILKRSFPAYKKYFMSLGVRTNYSLESVSQSKYVIGILKDSVPYISLSLLRKSQYSNPKFVTSDNLIQQIENVSGDQKLNIVFEAIPYVYKTKSTYSSSISIDGVTIFARIISVQIE